MNKNVVLKHLRSQCNKLILMPEPSQLFCRINFDNINKHSIC